MACLLSIALPGAGHLYLGRRAFAIAELAGGMTILVAAIARLVLVFVSVVREEAPALDLLRTCIPWAAVLIAYSLADGAFTWAVSRRRVILARPAGDATTSGGPAS